VILGFLISWLFYRKATTLKKEQKILFWLTYSLRAIALSLIFILLAEPVFKTRTTYQEPPLLTIAIGNSASIFANADSTEIKKFIKE